MVLFIYNIYIIYILYLLASKCKQQKIKIFVQKLQLIL